MSDSNVEMKRYPDAGAMARALASEVATRLTRAAAARGNATLVVSGGHSPVGFFEELRAQTLDWRRITVALADERWVEPGDLESNEHLVRAVLLSGNAAAARFVGLKNGAPTPELGASAAWEAFAQLQRPFDVTILGMGIEGHTASLFPGSPRLVEALDPSAARGCVPMRSPTPPHERLTLNLGALLDSRHIAILILGDAKLGTYARACAAGPVEEMPVRAVLRQRRVPVEVSWAPGRSG